MEYVKRLLHGSTMFHWSTKKYPHLTMTSIYPIKSYHSFSFPSAFPLKLNIIFDSKQHTHLHIWNWARWIDRSICSPGVSGGLRRSQDLRSAHLEMCCKAAPSVNRCLEHFPALWGWFFRIYDIEWYRYKMIMGFLSHRGTEIIHL
jgi:hypothetical protein